MMLHERRFKGVSNDPSGEVDGNTIFQYYQDGDVIWGDYSGGSIIKGTFSGLIIDNQTITFNYCHVNQDHQLLSGQCASTVEVLTDGRYRLHESWEWTGGKAGSGSSVVEEVKSF